MILEEEYEEAKGDMFPWGIGLGLTTFAASGFAAVAVYNGPAQASMCVLTSAASVAVGVCAAGLLRCRRTIKAWRDQKRLELAQREVEKMGALK
jgi:hypothetical protein